MNIINDIKNELVKNTYVCDICNKPGKHTEMIYIIGKGLYHVKCYKNSKK